MVHQINPKLAITKSKKETERKLKPWVVKNGRTNSPCEELVWSESKAELEKAKNTELITWDWCVCQRERVVTSNYGYLRASFNDISSGIRLTCKTNSSRLLLFQIRQQRFKVAINVEASSSSKRSEQHGFRCYNIPLFPLPFLLQLLWIVTVKETSPETPLLLILIAPNPHLWIHLHLHLHNHHHFIFFFWNLYLMQRIICKLLKQIVR